MKMRIPQTSSLYSFCRLRDVDTFCIGTRTSIKASGEKVPEIHGAHKTLDPHKKPEQQDFAKGKTPKKSMPTPQWCVHKQTPTPMLEEPLERQSEPEKDTPTQHFPDPSFRVDRAYAPYRAERVSRVPQQSVQPCVLFPTSSTSKPLQKGDSNGESVEREIPYGPLKYTC